MRTRPEESIVLNIICMDHVVVWGIAAALLYENGEDKQAVE
jgi:hypothetical protein